MNFGQVLESMIAKALVKTEEEILINRKDNARISEAVSKISEVAYLLGDSEYSEMISKLSSEIKIDNNKRDQFIASIRDTGLYFEAPNFANCELEGLKNLLYKNFNTQVEEPVLLPHKLLLYLKDKLKCNIPVTGDIILKNVFASPMYFLKLKQEAALRISARDLGSYKSFK